MVRPYPRFEGLERLIRAMATSLFVGGKNLEFARRGRPGPRSMWRGSRGERQRRYGGMRMRSTRSQPAASRTISEMEKRLAERAKVEHSPKPLAFAIRPRLRECGPSTWPLRLRPATMHMKISFPSQNCSQLSTSNFFPYSSSTSLCQRGRNLSPSIPKSVSRPDPDWSELLREEEDRSASFRDM